MSYQLTATTQQVGLEGQAYTLESAILMEHMLVGEIQAHCQSEKLTIVGYPDIPADIEHGRIIDGVRIVRQWVSGSHELPLIEPYWSVRADVFAEPAGA